MLNISQSTLDLNNSNNNFLITNIWNLYYNTLSEFFLELYTLTKNEEFFRLTAEIKTAWDICEKYINKNNPPKLHEDAEMFIANLWWISNIALAVCNLKKADFNNFIINLSIKLNQDWQKDWNRPSISADWIVNQTKTRTRLSTSLLKASLILKKVWENNF